MRFIRDTFTFVRSYKLNTISKEPCLACVWRIYFIKVSPLNSIFKHLRKVKINGKQ